METYATGAVLLPLTIFRICRKMKAGDCAGGNWRIPTKNEFQELIDSCTWEVEWGTIDVPYTQREFKHYKITGKNGNSIILPVVHSFDAYHNPFIHCTGYWTSTINEDDSDKAYIMYCDGDVHTIDSEYRCVGLCIRPVCDDK